MTGARRGTAAPTLFVRLGTLALLASVLAHGEAHATAPARALAAASAGALAAKPRRCELRDAFFTAQLRGAVEREVRWRAKDMNCEGMNRPDGLGLRVAFAGRAGRERLTFVFGVPRLAEGAAEAAAVPVNVTVIREGHGVYGTRGDDKCTLDAVRQTGLDVPPSRLQPRRWRIEARGFCLEPARLVTNDGRDAILVATFDFAGTVTWEPDLPEPPAASPEPSLSRHSPLSPR